MSVKSDSETEASSSSSGYLERLLSLCDRRAGGAFAGFFLFHSACQALRAGEDGVLIHAGWELQRPFVSAVLVVTCVPFAVFAWRRLRRGFWPERAQVDQKTRALLVLERFTLALVSVFSVWHLTQFAYPLLTGAIDESDVRGELIASLSSTEHGLPWSAFIYLCAVAAAAFFGGRQAFLLSSSSHSRALARAAIALAVCSYLFGSYAVIRCATGPILP